MEAREHAENLIRYFERIAHENDREVWWKGLSIAQEWLRLINATNPSSVELSTFIGVVHANRYRTSGWHDLALGAYRWINTKGILIPPYEEFFSGEGLSADIMFTATPLEHAQILESFFEMYNHEDPSSEMWAVGLNITQEWLRLIEVKEISKLEISILARKVFKDSQKYSSKIWVDTIIGICNWCRVTGNLDLIPDDFRGFLYEEK